MSFKRLIVHADRSPEGEARIRLARRIADVHHADVETFLIEPHPERALASPAPQSAPAYHAPLAELAQRIEREFNEKVHALHTHSDRIRTDAATHFRAADLVVLGPPVRDGLFIADDIFHAALFLSGRPCLVAPPGLERGVIGRRILVAWKDAREAARAVHDALPFLERADAICLAAFKPDADEHFLGQHAFHRIVTALKDRGLPLERSVTPAQQGSAFRALVREAQSFNADMVVMGAYGASRLNEVLFGGLTRDVLAGARWPVLMAH